MLYKIIILYKNVVAHALFIKTILTALYNSDFLSFICGSQEMFVYANKYNYLIF